MKKDSKLVLAHCVCVCACVLLNFYFFVCVFVRACVCLCVCVIPGGLVLRPVIFLLFSVRDRIAMC